MFRLFRRAILLLLIFGAGMIYERIQQRDLCEGTGGRWQDTGFCRGS